MNYVPIDQDLSISPAMERAIARDLSPSIAWPTFILAVALPSNFLSIGVLGFSRTIPLWVCTPVLGLLSYAHYTLVHEAIHNTPIPTRSKIPTSW